MADKFRTACLFIRILNIFSIILSIFPTKNYQPTILILIIPCFFSFFAFKVTCSKKLLEIIYFSRYLTHFDIFYKSGNIQDSKFIDFCILELYEISFENNKVALYC